MAPPAKAKWVWGQRTQDVDANGTATMTQKLMNAGTEYGTLKTTITADRHVRLEFTVAAGVDPLIGLEAWSNV
jgi:hypothetical protein